MNSSKIFENYTIEFWKFWENYTIELYYRIFPTPMCRELISLLNGIMRYNYMTMMKALYLDYSQDLTTTTNIFKKVAIFRVGL